MLTEFIAQWGPGMHGGPGWFIGPIFFLLFLGLIATVVVLAVRRRPCRKAAGERAREILSERYARGEISSEEYRERLDGLS
ncbi:SHOCT domain-containing protein [Saccharopolyspora oryzae]|uniref:SHOCT domain-containing protein n=1 Tax=Saccharopolyspora oryzae TaxID=2997343 RepID=A0ABT4V6Y3_9PSEU|nr:SHOCT domain-containing protein [Saccharopolyspora oryzae]MDA3629598.1 SHOCT domain-containing protein [Saccharopolyspora oryzae]